MAQCNVSNCASKLLSYKPSAPFRIWSVMPSLCVQSPASNLAWLCRENLICACSDGKDQTPASAMVRSLFDESSLQQSNHQKYYCRSSSNSLDYKAIWVISKKKFEGPFVWPQVILVVLAIFWILQCVSPHQHVLNLRICISRFGYENKAFHPQVNLPSKNLIEAECYCLKVRTKLQSASHFASTPIKSNTYYVRDATNELVSMLSRTAAVSRARGYGKDT